MLRANLPPLVLERKKDVVNDNNICKVCKQPIRVQIQKNTGLCSQVCENSLPDAA